MYDRHYNRHAAELWWKHREILRAISRRFPTSLSRRQAVIREHRELIARVREQDAEGAAAIVARHVEGSGRHILEQMGVARRLGSVTRRRKRDGPRHAQFQLRQGTRRRNEDHGCKAMAGQVRGLVLGASILFVEVTTDEGVSGWGEITTTTQARQPGALRGPAADRRRSSPATTRRRSSSSGTRSSAASPTWAAAAPRSNASAPSTSRCGTSAARCSASRSTSCSAAPVRDEIALYTHPDQRKFTSKEGVVAEIRAIVDSGHTALKFDPFPYQGAKGRRLPREQGDGYLDGSMNRKDEREAAELTALIRETAGPDVEVLIDAHGRFDVPDRDPALPHAGGGRRHRLVRGAGARPRASTR